MVFIETPVRESNGMRAAHCCGRSLTGVVWDRCIEVKAFS